MNGTNIQRAVQIQNAADVNWRIAGTGFFNSDSHRDILWEREKSDEAGVWFMEGTEFKRAAQIASPPGKPWRIAGADDFNGDGKTDILWEDRGSGKKMIWRMNGLEKTSSAEISFSAGPEWRVYATGKFGTDSTPDLALRNEITGAFAIWHLNAQATSVTAMKSVVVNNFDIDWKIVLAADFSLPPDGRTDLLLRHAVLGLNMVLLMNDNVNIGSYFQKSVPDTDWKLASQDPAISVWRLEKEQARPNFTTISALSSNSPPRVFLSYKVPPNSGFGVRIDRRKASATNWTTLAPNFALEKFVDSTVETGERYEYSVWRRGFGGFQHGAAEFTMAGDRVRPAESRGRVLLLVDETLAPQLEESLALFESDLAGDGWESARRLVPRHDDQTWANNPAKIAAVKSLIVSEWKNNSNTVAIVLVGHVAIPYSGFTPTDGHDCGSGGRPDHRGAWPADIYYTDVDTLDWGDKLPAYNNCDFELTSNLPGDGKFDQDTYPLASVMKMFIGRIDFARLPVLSSNPPGGLAKRTEAELLNQYFAKNHRYRHKALPWQKQLAETYDRALVYGHFPFGEDVNSLITKMALHASSAAFTGPDRLAFGDCLVPKKYPALLGFLAGAGQFDRINGGATAIESTSASVLTPGQEPNTAFTVLLASFMGDWNLGLNNLPRTLLASPQFGLASMWTRDALWRMDAPGLGEPLGMALVRMVNGSRNFSSDRLRELTILGDPTLQLRVLAPPIDLKSSASNGAVSLNWKKPEPDSQFFVYRAAQPKGPFIRVDEGPLQTSSFTDATPLRGTNVYMLRTQKLTEAGCGSFTNLSQGVFSMVKNGE